MGALVGLAVGLYTLTSSDSFPLRLFHFALRRGPWGDELADFESIIPVYEFVWGAAGAVLSLFLGGLLRRGGQGRILGWCAGLLALGTVLAFGFAWYVRNQLTPGPVASLRLVGAGLGAGVALWLLWEGGAPALRAAGVGARTRAVGWVLGLALLLLLPACPAGRALAERFVPQKEVASPVLSGQRVCLLGIDGLTWRVADPLLAAGELPHIARLMAGGVRVDLISQYPMISPAIWTTMATGVSPSRHGITDWVGVLPGKNQLVPVNSTMRQVPALWDMVASSGGTAGVVGYYVTWPTEPVSGYMVSDLLEFAEVDTLPQLVHPEDLLARFPISSASLGGLDRRDSLFGRLAMDLLRAQPTDFFVLYIRGTDDYQHAHWHTLFPEDFGGEVGCRGEDMGEIITGYYRAVDAFLGEFLDAAGSETIAFVVSDHGFEAARKGGGYVYHPARLLEALGYLYPGDTAEEVDWERTTVFLAGERRWKRRRPLYFNLIGREAHGIIPAGQREEYAQRIAE